MQDAGCRILLLGLAVENGFAAFCSKKLDVDAKRRRVAGISNLSELLLFAGPCFVVSHLSALSRDLSVQTWKHVSIGT